MALKSETQYQMYLDVLDILEKSGHTTKVEKDGNNTKYSYVYRNGKLCGEVWAVSAPPAKKESSLYSLSSHAKLVEAKERITKEADEHKLKGRGNMVNFVEGEWSDTEGCLWYYGHSEESETAHEWVAIVNEKYPAWREKSPLYLQSVGEMEKLKKRKTTTAEEFRAIEKEAERLAVCFENLADYRDSKDLAAECRKHVTGRKMEVLGEATIQLEKLEKSKGDSSKFYGEMVAGYTELTKKFAMITPFEDSAEKLERCQTRAEECKKEEIRAIYMESIIRLSELQLAERKLSETATSDQHAKMVADYEELLKRFESIKDYEDATTQAELCQKEISKFTASRTAACYKEAKKELDTLEERPETNKLTDYFHRTRKYRKIAKQFDSIESFDDAALLEKKCSKQYKSYRWKLIKKVAPFVLGFIALVTIVVLVVALVSGRGGEAETYDYDYNYENYTSQITAPFITYCFSGKVSERG